MATSARKGKRGVRVVGRSRRAPGILGLFFLTVAALGGLGWFVNFLVTDPAPDPAFYAQGEGSILNVHSHAIQLGETSERLQRLYPTLAYIGPARSKAMFRKNDAAHTVWFTNLNDKMVVYRLRYDKNFPGDSEEFILTQFGRRYGRTVYNQCSDSAGTQRRDCHFRWYGEDSTSVDVYTRVNRNGASGQLHLAVVVTNTYLEKKAKKK